VDTRIWKISLEQIEATVADFLGPSRVEGNRARPAFSRHVSMYLARHVGGWSYPKISRFYNGRNYTSVMAAVRKVERLRVADESVDALIDILTDELATGPRESIARLA
jgi:chromosomal replication initiator protein